MNEFNEDTFLKEEFNRVINDNRIRSVIETGTYLGYTASFFAQISSVHLVVTIDISKRWIDMDNRAEFLLGDSRVEVTKALSMVKEKNAFPLLIYLDAHPDCIDKPVGPLADELKAIASFFSGNPGIALPWIAIHDCVVPGRDFGFDTYSDGPISWDTHKAGIEAIYPNGCDVTYNNEASGAYRGCMFVSPHIA